MPAEESREFALRVMTMLLEEEARQVSPAGSIQACAEHLVRHGFELLRISTSIPTLHPEVYGLEIEWLRGGPMRTRDIPHAIFDSAEYRGTPVEEMDRTRRKVRCRLAVDGDCGYPVLRRLIDLGATDYVLLPLTFSNGRLGGLSLATDRPGGFSDTAFEAFDLLAPVIAVCFELRYMQSSMRSLLRTYLGQNAAERVLAGGFRRGSGEIIRAALWYSDMRGFTALGDHLSPRELVALVDRYFETVAGPVEPHGGEILKFVGDAVLAIFPVKGDEVRDPCGRALASARDSLAALGRWSAERTARGDPALGMGVSLHLGEVMYGNIGARERLDFTVVGASVNEAVRMEGLCKALKVPLVMSSAFARALPGVELVSLGMQQLRGVAAPQEVFTLATAPRSPPWA